MGILCNTGSGWSSISRGNYISTPCSPTHRQYNSRTGLMQGGLHCSVSSGQHANIELHPCKIQMRRADGQTRCRLNSPAHRVRHGECIRSYSTQLVIPSKIHHTRVFHCASAYTQVFYIVACDYYHTHLP